MLPFSPIAIGFTVLMFLSRSSFSGIILGGLLTLAGMHLWPDTMQIAYDWVGEVLRTLGLLEE